MNIPVLYEDEYLLIVDKPAGLLTIPTPKKESRTLTSILNADLKEKNSAYRAHPCHRLDRETSGVVIYAKGKAMQKKMMELFKRHLIKKTYLAFVQGNIKQESGRIEKTVDNRPALTVFKVSQRMGNFTVVEVNPQTGRKNQIRIHFKAIGHPLVGETRFAFRKDYALKAKRLCLHAEKLEFVHPVTGKDMCIEAPLPGDLNKFLLGHLPLSR